MDDEVCSALEAAEEARALLPALLSAFDNHQVEWVGTTMMRQAELEFVNAVTAGSSVKILPAV